jgi:hypothetical protein
MINLPLWRRAVGPTIGGKPLVGRLVPLFWQVVTFRELDGGTNAKTVRLARLIMTAAGGGSQSTDKAE